MSDGNVFLWHESAENDYLNVLLYLQRWLVKHKAEKTFGEITIDLAIDPDLLANAVAEINIHLRIFGDKANACKRAAAVIATLCKHCPIILRRDAGKVTEGDLRTILLVNAKAAYEVGEAIARQASHDQYLEGGWCFENRAVFPSIHSYVEFILSLAKLHRKDPLPEHAVSRIALILELVLYRTNPKIAGLADPSLVENIFSKQPAYLQYGMLNLERNSEDKVNIGKYKAKLKALQSK